VTGQGAGGAPKTIEGKAPLDPHAAVAKPGNT
jgi:hypothetical protein